MPRTASQNLYSAQGRLPWSLPVPGDVWEEGNTSFYTEEIYIHISS